MALFKQFRGNRASLDAQPLTDGYAYFCVDDGTFHIDYADENGVLHRKQISAKDAETIMGVSLDELKTEFTTQDAVILHEAQTYTDEAIAEAIGGSGGSAEIQRTIVINDGSEDIYDFAASNVDSIIGELPAYGATNLADYIAIVGYVVVTFYCDNGAYVRTCYSSCFDAGANEIDFVCSDEYDNTALYCRVNYNEDTDRMEFILFESNVYDSPLIIDMYDISVGATTYNYDERLIRYNAHTHTLQLKYHNTPNSYRMYNLIDYYEGDGGSIVNLHFEATDCINDEIAYVDIHVNTDSTLSVFDSGSCAFATYDSLVELQDSIPDQIKAYVDEAILGGEW